MTSPRRDASTLSLTDEALTLQAQRERLVASLHDRPEALKRPWLELTRLTEAWLRSALKRHLKPVGVPWRALLLGSFARREPALHSDLDLLLEVQEPEALSHPQLAEAVTALLDEARAMRLRLSHVVRSPGTPRRADARGLAQRRGAARRPASSTRSRGARARRPPLNARSIFFAPRIRAWRSPSA